MHDTRDTARGRFLGWFAVAAGILYLGLGLALVWRAKTPDGLDALLLGGLAFVTGCVVLHRRNRMAESKQGDAGPGDSADAKKD